MTTLRAAAAMAATPAERPSMLSSMLKELIRPTIHSTLTAAAIARARRAAGWLATPVRTMTTATKVCTARRTRQSSPRRSSARPSNISTVPPASSIQSLLDWCIRPGK